MGSGELGRPGHCPEGVKEDQLQARDERLNISGLAQPREQFGNEEAMASVLKEALTA